MFVDKPGLGTASTAGLCFGLPAPPCEVPVNTNFAPPDNGGAFSFRNRLPSSLGDLQRSDDGARMEERGPAICRRQSRSD
jgi:hypothetical protein